ncbi:MAG: hypothetical protein JOY82_09765 [Streptosporangiaceae bacterium]|nr:hypothetical protein [Streptosporangiaceae bacterium]MBV9854797.1 hypothetical protein [Streptosporangiaceae bacterium]
MRGWDLAKAIGQPADLDAGLATAVLTAMRPLMTAQMRGPEGKRYSGLKRRYPSMLLRPTGWRDSSDAGRDRPQATSRRLGITPLWEYTDGDLRDCLGTPGRCWPIFPAAVPVGRLVAELAAELNGSQR